MTALTVPGASQRAAHPWTIRLAQVGWWLTLALSLTLFVPSVIQVYQDQRVVCSGSACTPDAPTATAAHNLQAIGWTTQTFATFELIISLVTLVVWLSIGLFIAWRKWIDVMALLISAQAVTQSVSQTTSVETLRISIWFIPGLALSFLSGLLVFLLLALFPSGRFVPSWLKWLVIPFLLFNLMPLPIWPDAITNTIFDAAHVLWFTFMGILIVCQIYRYVRISTPVEQQQTKWVIFAFSFVIIGQFVFALPQAFIASLAQPYSLYSIMLNSADVIILLVAPFCIAIAIMRYRLYDIDVVIKRTLVYGALTAILAALYFGLVIGAQQLTHQFTGQHNAPQQPVVIVLTTLLIAALFTPLRANLQRWIDRRFDRSHYDAAKTLAAFSQTLRSEVDLRQLNEQLLDVVDETMRPAHASLWLRAPKQGGAL